MSKMKKAKTLAALKERSREINSQIDAIVLDGGIVGITDPLMNQLSAILKEIRKMNNSR